MIPHGFPKQNKLIRRLRSPWADVASCSVTNRAATYNDANFITFNRENRDRNSFIREAVEAAPKDQQWSFLSGEMIGGGVLTSVEGPACTRIVSNSLYKQMNDYRKTQSQDPMAMMRYFGAKMSRGPEAKVEDPAHGLVLGQRTALKHMALSADMEFQGECLKANKKLSQMAKSKEQLDELKKNVDMNIGLQATHALLFTALFLPQKLDYSHEIEKELETWEREMIGRIGHAAERFTGVHLPVNPITGMVGPPIKDERGFEAQKQKDKELSATITHEEIKKMRDEKLQELLAARGRVEVVEPTVALSVGNIGLCRAFGVPMHKDSLTGQSKFMGRQLEYKPLSSDCWATKEEERKRIQAVGGTVSPEGYIFGDARYPVSREFGRLQLKQNRNAGPMDQIVTADPDVASWTMRAGDLAVLATPALFQNVTAEETSTDDLVTFVRERATAGATPAEIAAALCDYATARGAKGNLNVTILRAEDPTGPENTTALGAALDVRYRTEAAKTAGTVRESRLIPGPFYPSRLANNAQQRKEFVADLERCGLTFAEFLELRCAAVEHSCDAMKLLRRSLLAAYPAECGMMMAVNSEEEAFFSAAPPAAEHNREARRQFFKRKADIILEIDQRPQTEPMRSTDASKAPWEAMR